MQVAPALDSEVLSAAVGWVEQLLLGSVANSVAVIGVAAVGALMLTGRADWRLGARVVAGCFLIFGATTIVSGLTLQEPERPDIVDTATTADMLVPAGRPPIDDFDPYAGAAPVQRPISKEELRIKLQTHLQPNTFSAPLASPSSPPSPRL